MGAQLGGLLVSHAADGKGTIRARSIVALLADPAATGRRLKAAHRGLLWVHLRSENATSGLLARLFSLANSQTGFEASPVGSTAIEACELLRP